MKLLLFIILIAVSSCTNTKHNRYELAKIDYIPDSLIEKHRNWITETVRAASQHMSAGDYEDVDNTIRQAGWQADEIYERSEMGLKFCVDDNYYNCIHLRRSEMSTREKYILDSMLERARNGNRNK